MKGERRLIDVTSNPKVLAVVSFIFAGLFSVAYFGVPVFLPAIYTSAPEVGDAQLAAAESPVLEDVFVVTHVPTPQAVKAIYMTSCVVATPDFRSRLIRLVEETELNALVIDIKDYSGRISFESDNPLLADSVSDNCYASDMKEFIGVLHGKDIYVIGRITVFQDPFYTKRRPDLAVKKASATTTVWTDYKGLAFIDVGAREYWDYIAELGEEAYAIGFDELNFDYIRFPSDGNMRDIYYPFSEQKIIEDPDFGKAAVLRRFFAYLSSRLQNSGVVLSADLFGMVTTNTDDLNIGQVLEYAEPYFDYIAPMVYPSHYPNGFNGFANPNDYPYEVVKFSMDSAVDRLIAASSTPTKLRPWLQDFDYGGIYDVDEVRAQIQATYDAGLTSWMLWNASNVYTRGALGPAATTSVE